MIEFYDGAGDPLTALAFTALEAGVDSDVVALEAWNDRGSPGGADRENVVLILQTESPAASGVYVSSGVPPQDELWGLYRVVGYDNTADTSWTVPLTGWLPLGAYSGIHIARIPADCGVELELKMHPPPWATATSYAWQLVPLYDAYSRPLPTGLGIGPARGILTHNGQRDRGYIIRGLEVTPTGTPDDVVHSAPGLWLYAGSVYGAVTVDTTLNQNDATPAALASGELYYAVLSRNASGLTVTKGTKGVAPDIPAAPAGEPIEAVVTVSYQAGGTSVIAASDISGPSGRGRFLTRHVSGLDIEVSAGEALYGETFRFRDLPTTLEATDDTTETLWLTSAGGLELAAAEPDTAALALYDVTAAAGVVTALVDRRIYAEPEVVLELRSAVGAAYATYWHGDPLDVEAVHARVSDNGGGSSGATTVEVEVDGASIWDSGTEDLRPTFAFDATTLSDDESAHQVARIATGDSVELSLATTPVGGTPATTWAWLVCRPVR